MLADSFDVRGLVVAVLVVVVPVVLARGAASAMGGWTSHREQLRWLLERRQSDLAAIRALEATAAEVRSLDRARVERVSSVVDASAFSTRARVSHVTLRAGVRTMESRRAARL